MKYTSPKLIKQVLSENGFSPLKKFGQNFLTDENIVKKIAEIAKVNDKNVVEIGPGLGALSSHLLTLVKKLVAIEIDNGFYGFLKQTFSDKENFSVINADVLKVDIEALAKNEFNDEPFILAANLPYYITSACIMTFFKANINIDRMVVMVQKEVAKRICAKPGESDYGSFTVITNFFGKPKMAFTVSKRCFLPKPEVDSAVVSIEIDKNNAVNPETFIKFVRGCFAMKRKTLVNNLKKSGYLKDDIIAAIKTLSINENARAEELTVNHYIDLINILT